MAGDVKMELDAATVHTLEIKDGKVHAIGINAPVWFYFEYAQLLMTRAADCIPHQQRPLQRKIDTVVSKTAELVKALKMHKQYCEDLEQRKAERREETRDRQLERKFERSLESGKFARLVESLNR